MRFWPICLCLTALGAHAATSTDLPLEAAAFPQCSQQCLVNALESEPALAQNFKLLCQNVELEKAIQECAIEACTFPDQQRSDGANSDLCSHEPVENHVVLVTLVLGLMGIITQGVIGLRIYARRRITYSMGIDDYLIGLAGLSILSVQLSGSVDIILWGLGKHTFNINPKSIPKTLLIYWLDEIAYQIAMTLVKSSILCFYLRIFPSNRFRYLVCTMIGFVILTGIAFTAVTIFQCTPIRGVFDKSVDFHCINNNAATYGSSGVSIFTDFMILLMPIPNLLRLKVSEEKRRFVLIMFSFGTFASIVSVVRLPFIIQFGKSKDLVFDNLGPGMWTFAEMASAVIAASLPSLKPLARKWKWLPQIFSFSDSEPVALNAAIPPPPGGRPPVRQQNVSAVFNSLFSRYETQQILGGCQPKYFCIKNGKIVPVDNRNSGISLGLPQDWDIKFSPDGEVPWSTQSGDMVDTMHPQVINGKTLLPPSPTEADWDASLLQSPALYWPLPPERRMEIWEMDCEKAAPICTQFVAIREAINQHECKLVQAVTLKHSKPPPSPTPVHPGERIVK